MTPSPRKVKTKNSRHVSSICYGNHLLFSMSFFISVIFKFQAFHVIFLQIFPVISIESSKVYFMFLVSVFAIFNIDDLNVCHRNLDVNKNHFNCKTFRTDILDINRIRYSYGEMTEITYPHFGKRYSKYIFKNSMRHNLQRAEENGDKFEFYWINFISSLLFLRRKIYNSKLKVISSLVLCYILPFHTMRSVFHLIVLVLS